MLTADACHQCMLEAIASLLIHGAKVLLQSILMKDQAHIGIRGNEMAGQLANKAAEQSAAFWNIPGITASICLLSMCCAHRVGTQLSQAALSSVWQDTITDTLQLSPCAPIHNHCMLGFGQACRSACCLQTAASTPTVAWLPSAKHCSNISQSHVQAQHKGFLAALPPVPVFLLLALQSSL